MATKNQVEWRRNKVFDLLAKNRTPNEIADTLKVRTHLIYRDIAYLRNLKREKFKSLIDEDLPIEYATTLRGLDLITRDLWARLDSGNDNDVKSKVLIFTLIKEVVILKLELLTNGTVLERVISEIKRQKDEMIKQPEPGTDGTYNKTF